MIDALISAGSSIVVGVLALIGVIVTNNHANSKMQNDLRTSQAVTEEKLNELTREVRLHNDFANRIPVLEEKIDVANHRIRDLEDFHRPQ